MRSVIFFRARRNDLVVHAYKRFINVSQTICDAETRYFGSFSSKLSPLFGSFTNNQTNADHKHKQPAPRNLSLSQIEPKCNLLFEKFWTPEECDKAKREGRAVSGKLCQYPLDAIVKCRDSFPVNKVRIPDSISRNRALHGDVVCVLLDKPVTQSNTSENVSSFEKPSPLDQFLTSGTINTTFEFEVKMRAPSGRVVAIEHLADRPEIFMIPKREELKQAINESSHYVLFHPRDSRFPPFRVKVEPHESSSKSSELTPANIEGSFIPLECLDFLLNELDKGREPVIAIRPLKCWSRYSQFPDGALSCLNNNWKESIVGCTNDFKTESNICLHMNGLQWREWSMIPELEKRLEENENGSPKWLLEALRDPTRRELRYEKVFTIDPLHSKDLDDALHVREVENEKYLLSVHIADVSHFVKSGDAIDKEARRRICTAYHGSRVLPMLPNLLSTNVCSILPNLDRLAISVLVTLNKDGTRDASRAAIVTRSVIRSKARLSYDVVESYLIAKKNKTKGEFESFGIPLEICKQIDILDKLTEAIRQRKVEKGLLEMNANEFYRFRNRSNNAQSVEWPDEVCIDEKHPNSHRLIEQCMVIANNIAAEHVLLANARYKAPGMVRTQEPDEKNLIRRIESLIPLPYKKVVHLQPTMSSVEMLNVLQERLPPETFLSVFRRLYDILGNAEYISIGTRRKDRRLGNDEEEEIEELNTLSNIMNDDDRSITSQTDLMEADENRTMEEITEQLQKTKIFQHARLLLSIYTHFTSPIRRYADLAVHRILSAAIDGNAGPPENMEMLAERCTYFSKKHKIAAVEFKKVVFNEIIKRNHPNGYFCNEAVVLRIKATGPISRYKNGITENENKEITTGKLVHPKGQNENKEVKIKSNRLASLPSCDVTILIPEANCLILFQTSHHGVVIEGTTTGHESELYDCTVSGTKGISKFVVGSKCNVLLIPGPTSFRIEMPRTTLSSLNGNL